MGPVPARRARRAPVVVIGMGATGRDLARKAKACHMMTFQVSDTALQTNLIRRTALRHGSAYLFGTGILAITINLVASLGSSFASGG